jgi:hypothetical protein
VSGPTVRPQSDRGPVCGLSPVRGDRDQTGPVRPDRPEPDDSGALARVRAQERPLPEPDPEPPIDQLERQAATLTGPALADLAERLLRAHGRCMARLREQEREAVRAKVERA